MILLVHGYDGSGPGHWQHWLRAELEGRGVPVSFPELSAPTEPQRAAWVAELAQLVAAAPSPVTLVAHSLGCWAVDHYIAEHGAEHVRAALLVAPPSPYSLFEPIQSFLPPPQRRDAWAPIAEHSLLAGSDDDDHASAEELEEIAQGLGVPFRLFPGAGHINAAAGYGPWPFAVEWLQEVGAVPR